MARRLLTSVSTQGQPSQLKQMHPGTSRFTGDTNSTSTLLAPFTSPTTCNENFKKVRPPRSPRVIEIHTVHSSDDYQGTAQQDCALFNGAQASNASLKERKSEASFGILDFYLREPTPLPTPSLPPTPVLVGKPFVSSVLNIHPARTILDPAPAVSNAEQYPRYKNRGRTAWHHARDSPVENNDEPRLPPKDQHLPILSLPRRCPSTATNTSNPPPTTLPCDKALPIPAVQKSKPQYTLFPPLEPQPTTAQPVPAPITSRPLCAPRKVSLTGSFTSRNRKDSLISTSSISPIARLPRRPLRILTSGPADSSPPDSRWSDDTIAVDLTSPFATDFAERGQSLGGGGDGSEQVYVMQVQQLEEFGVDGEECAGGGDGSAA
ncbi:hypothetical protein LTR66_009284 [Elasticomyces elasticus]|nr:hypothetical protein LTR66_009284 [Elasticomyces elasticus]